MAFSIFRVENSIFTTFFNSIRCFKIKIKLRRGRLKLVEVDDNQNNVACDVAKQDEVTPIDNIDEFIV